MSRFTEEEARERDRQYRRWELMHLPLRIFGFIFKWAFKIAVVLVILYAIATYFGNY